MLTTHTTSDGNIFSLTNKVKILLGVLFLLFVSLFIYFVISIADDYFGHSKDELNSIINEQRVAINQLKEANEALSKTLELEREQHRLREEYTQRTLDEINQNYQNLVNSEKTKSEKIKNVTPTKVANDARNVNKVVITEQLTLEEAKKISEIQISNIWENYQRAVRE